MIESEHPIKVVHDFRRDARAAASETVYKDLTFYGVLDRFMGFVSVPWRFYKLS